MSALEMSSHQTSNLQEGSPTQAQKKGKIQKRRASLFAMSRQVIHWNLPDWKHYTFLCTVRSVRKRLRNLDKCLLSLGSHRTVEDVFVMNPLSKPSCKPKLFGSYFDEFSIKKNLKIISGKRTGRLPTVQGKQGWSSRSSGATNSMKVSSPRPEFIEDIWALIKQKVKASLHCWTKDVPFKNWIQAMTGEKGRLSIESLLDAQVCVKWGSWNQKLSSFVWNTLVTFWDIFFVRNNNFVTHSLKCS